MEYITLEKLEVGKQCLVDMGVLRKSLNLEEYIDHMLNAMVYDLRAYVLAEEVDKRTEIVHFHIDRPATWWDELKFDVLRKHKLSRWFVNRYPVKTARFSQTKTVTFRKLATYPKANIALPGLGSTIVYRTQIYEE